jgi:hypothetical protein
MDCYLTKEEEEEELKKWMELGIMTNITKAGKHHQLIKCYNCNRNFKKGEKIVHHYKNTSKGSNYYCLECAETLNIIGDE